MKSPKWTQTPEPEQRERIEFEALEPRVLFSATSVDPGDEPVYDAGLVQDVALVAPEAASASEVALETAPAEEILRQLNHRVADQEGQARREIVFIASDLEGSDVIAGHLDASYEIHWIKSDRDGLSQIAAALEGRSGIDAIHIVSHGEPGKLLLGNTLLDARALSGEHDALLRQIGAALSEDADLLIYGCDFGAGEEGAAALERLAAATGADVAASDDKTGHADFGGDWILETQSGAIETAAFSVAHWRGVLAPAVLTVAPSSLSVFDSSGNPVTVGTPVFANGYAVWSNAGTVGSQAIDLIARVIFVGSNDSVTFENPASGTDDASFILNSGATNQAGETIIEWSIVLAGTSTLATGDITFTIGDIDGISGNPFTRETVIPSLNGLTAYGANDPTNIEFFVNAGEVQASGTENQNTGGGPQEPEAAALFTWRNVSNWRVTYQLATNSGTSTARFTHDGDGDFSFPSLESEELIGIDLDDNNSTVTGTGYRTLFTEGGSAVTIADSDADIFQNAVLGTTLGSATVVLTNAQVGDELLVNGSTSATGTINGVNYTINSSGGQITVQFTNSATLAVYEDLIKSVTFRNNQPGLSGVDRNVEVTVFNTTFGTTSNTAVTTIDINRRPVANPQTVTTPYLTPISINLLGNDSDPDGDTFGVQGTPTLVNPAHGTLTGSNNSWTFNPANGFSGNAVINYTIADALGATSSSTHTVTVQNAPPVLGDPSPAPGSPFINSGDPTNLIVPATDNVSFTLNLADYITDPNSETLTFAANMTGVPGWVTFNPATGVFSGTPPVANGGIVTIPITVTDQSGGSFVGSVTIIPSNPVPVANPQTVTTPYLTPIVVNFTANDTDPDGDAISVQGTPTLVNPAHGTLTQNAGVWTFTPATGFSGTAVINYTIRDADAATASSTHTVIVENAPPALSDPDPTPGTPFVNPFIATNLVVPVTDGTPTTLDIDDYITDPNPDTLVYSPNMTGVPAWITFNPATNQFAINPPVANAAPVTIPITVTDGQGGTFAGTITINPTNPGPVANPQTVTTPYLTPVVVNFTANDSDPDGDAINLWGPPTLVNPAQGALSFANGVWTFTPATGFSGSAVINYTISDSDGRTSSSTHTVVVENAPPVLGDPNPAPGTPFINPNNPTNLIVPTVDNTPFTLNLGDYVTDPNPETLTFAANMTGVPAWITFNPATGQFSGTPPVANAAPVTIPVTVTDQSGGSFVGSVTISPSNPAPVANPQTVTTPYLTPIVVNFTGNDSDPDGDAISVQGTPTLVNPAYGTLTQNAGVWTFTPATGFSGTAVINYTIADADGATATSTHTVVVENAPPVLVVPNNPAPGSPSVNPLNATNLIVPVTDNAAFTLNLGDFIIDPNPGPLTFTANMTGVPAWITFNPATGQFSGTPPVANAAPVNIPITGTDQNGGSFAGSVTFSPVNPAPLANPQTVTTPYLTPIVLNLTGNDSDPDGDMFNLWGTPTLVNASHGALSFANGVWTFTPATGFSGTAVINYAIADSDGAIASSTHTVVVENAPPALSDPNPAPGTPFINPNSPTNLIVPAVDNTPFTLNLGDYVTDPNPETLTFAANMTGVPAWITFNPATGQFSGTPPVANAAPVTIPVTVTDQSGGSFVGSVTISPSNPAPVANPQTVTTPYLTPIVVNFTGNDSDPDGDAISVQGTPTLVNPAYGTLTQNAGVWTFTPATGFSGTAVINYTIADADGATATSTHTVIVENAPPVLGDPNPAPGTPSINPNNPTNLIVPAVDNTPFTLNLGDYVTDPNPETLTFAANMTGVPAWITFNPATGQFSGTPPVANAAPVTIPVTVTDQSGGSFVGSVTISPSNPAPVANPQTVTTPYLTPIVVNFTGNDSDPDGDAISVQGTPTLVNPAQGTLTQNAGVWTFTPATGFSGTAVINYTIADADGAAATSTHTVVVENAPPVLGDPDPTDGTPYIDPQGPTNLIAPVNDNTSFTLNLGDYVTDPNPETLTFTANMTGVPAWITFNPATGQFSGTAPVANGPSIVIPVTVTDQSGGVFTGTVTICPRNPAPVANPQTVTTPYLTPIVVNFTGNDSDPDGDAISVQGTPTLVNPAHGTLTQNAGVWTFTPATGFSGTAVINYTIADADGATATSTHTVIVENAPPVLGDPNPAPGTPFINPNSPTNLIVPAVDNTPFTLNLGDYVTDPNPETLTFTANMTGVPAWITFNPATGQFSGTPPVANAAHVTIPVTVTDQSGGSFVGSVTISPSNPGPDASDDDYQVLQTSPAILVGNALGNDSDPDGDALSVIPVTDAAGSNGGLFTIAANGNVVFNPNGAFDDLLGGQSRTTTFTYTVEDADGDTATATITVTVTGVNSPPKPDSGRMRVNIGSTGGRLNLQAPTDPDGDPLTIRVKNLPRVGVLRLSNGKPVKVGQVLSADQLKNLVYDAPANYRGDKPVRFVYSVSDGQKTALAKVDITITKSKCFSTYFPSLRWLMKKARH